jgi:hypothetical protein
MSGAPGLDDPREFGARRRDHHASRFDASDLHDLLGQRIGAEWGRNGNGASQQDGLQHRHKAFSVPGQGARIRLAPREESASGPRHDFA